MSESERAAALALLQRAGDDADQIFIIDAVPAALSAAAAEAARTPMPRPPGFIAITEEGSIVLPLRSTAAHALVEGEFATVKLSQCFDNPLEQPADAEYRLPLPSAAAVSDFVISIGDRRIRGIIRERQQAEFFFAEARRQRLSASRLTLDRDGALRFALANIPPRAAIAADLRYRQPLTIEDGSAHFEFPLALVGNGDCSLAVELSAIVPPKEIRVSHKVEVHATSPMVLRLSDRASRRPDVFVLQFPLRASRHSTSNQGSSRVAPAFESDAIPLTPGAAFIAIDALPAAQPSELLGPGPAGAWR